MSTGKLSFIGLGLYDEQDMSLKALETIQKADFVYAEFYTSILSGTTIKKLEKQCQKEIIILNRKETENADILFSKAKTHHVAFLVGGDALTATTHVELRMRAMQQGINTTVVHGSSVVTAVPGLLGLQQYKFGRITTLVTPEKNYFPLSPYDVIKENKKQGLHSLVLLDIKADKNHFMSADQAIQILWEMEQKKQENLFSKESIICIVARAGSHNPLIKADSIQHLENQEFGSPLHALVIPGDLHFMEIEGLQILANLSEPLAKKLQKV